MRWLKRNAAKRRAEREELAFLPAAREVLEAPPSLLARAVSITVVAFAVCAVAWASLARMDVVVSAQGRIVPSGKVKVIQAADAGVVRAIHVRDGQRVQKGDVLVELDATTTEADRRQLIRELSEAGLEVARLNAQLNRDAGDLAPPSGADADLVTMHRQLLHSRLSEFDERREVLNNKITQLRADRDAVRVKVEQLDRKLPLLRQRLDKLKSLSEKKYISEFDYVDAQIKLLDQEKNLEAQRFRLQQAEAALNAAKRQLQQVDAEFRRETLAALAEASRRRNAAAQELVKADQRKALQQLRAPVDGVVQQLAVNTEGGVVTAAQSLMVVVPSGTGMEVEAQALNRDVGSIEAGQRVSVKVETYSFTRHGAIPATLQWVGTDAVMDERRGPVYPIRVALADTRMPNNVNGRRGRIMPGMNVTADIVVGKRRLIEYFLGPILRYRDESLRER
jgi:hemolysin D